MSKKKIAVILTTVVVVAAVVTGGWYLQNKGMSGSNGDKVYVEAVADLTNMNSGTQNRYSGIVEPQKSWEVKKDADKEIKEILVSEGDKVEEGTPLFSYDTDAIKNEIAEAKLELEGIENEISSYYNQISGLEAERRAASEDMKFQYTTEIQSIQTTIKQTEYSKESKKAEIAKKEESLEKAVVSSQISGIVKSINENGYDPYSGEELPFMTVLSTGDYRVKGTINEQNIWTLETGAAVIIRSRVDEEQTWAGIIAEINTNSAAEDTDNMNNMSSDSGMMETATKYPFYISLDSTEGLLLGQHVYIELDMGQAEEKEGIWLYESYVIVDETGSYVWADNGSKKIEKRAVELGEYDTELGMYEILSGLTTEDYIAYPMNALYEGVTTVTDETEVDYESPMYKEEESMMMEGESSEDIMPEGEYSEDMMIEGESSEDIATEDESNEEAMSEETAESEVSE